MLTNELNIGNNPILNNLTMFRKFDLTKGFQTYFKSENNINLTDDSQIIINYLQYYKNANGEIINELLERRFYIVPNSAQFPAASLWFNSLARTPITAVNGIIDEIENTLLNLPLNVENGYILQNL